MAFQGPFIVFVAVFWVSGLAASSLALFVGSVAANPEVANQMAPALFVPQLLFVGFYIRMSQARASNRLDAKKKHSAPRSRPRRCVAERFLPHLSRVSS